MEDRIYRYRREFKEQGHTVVLQHYVAVEREDGTQQIMRMGVDSRKLPYANVNDEVKVTFFQEDDYAFGVHHHRTWAFGAAYTVVGLVFLVCGIPMLLAVGKPIEVDPESPEALKELEEREASHKKKNEAFSDQSIFVQSCLMRCFPAPKARHVSAQVGVRRSRTKAWVTCRKRAKACKAVTSRRGPLWRPFRPCSLYSCITQAYGHSMASDLG